MQNRQIRVLTYNVSVDNDNLPVNQADLINYIINSTADVVCLQEVTQQFFNLIKSSEKLSDSYHFEMPYAFNDSEKFANKRPSGGILMFKKELNATFCEPVKLADTVRFRYLSYGSFTLNGVKIAIGTPHLESVFFDEYATEIKVKQLEQVHNRLEETKPDCLIIAGDINFTGGDQLELENAAINKIGLTDVWRALHPTTECEDDEDYRQNHITWDSANNINVKYAGEFHRPDRIFMRLFKPKMEAVKIERVISNMSDHYGLTSVFELNS